MTLRCSANADRPSYISASLVFATDSGYVPGMSDLVLHDNAPSVFTDITHPINQIIELATGQAPTANSTGGVGGV